MTRTMYENEDDRNNEQAIMERLAAAWNIEYHKLMSYRMDCSHEGRRNRWLCRSQDAPNEWPVPNNHAVNEQSHTACQYHQSLKLPTVFVVNDGWWLHYTHLHDVRGSQVGVWWAHDADQRQRRR